MNTTTQRHPRRLGANVRDASYACALERPQRRHALDRWCWALVVVGLLILVALAIAYRPTPFSA